MSRRLAVASTVALAASVGWWLLLRCTRRDPWAGFYLHAATAPEQRSWWVRLDTTAARTAYHTKENQT